MSLKALSEVYRFNVRRDDCNDLIAPGRYGHIYQDRDRVCLCFTEEGSRGRVTAHKKAALKRLLSWCRLDLECEAEAIWSCSRPSPAEFRLLMKAAGVKRRRTISEDQRARMSVQLENARNAKSTVRKAGKRP